MDILSILEKLGAAELRRVEATHKHKCGKCHCTWEHGDDANVGSPMHFRQNHTCPRCFSGPWTLKVRS